MASQIRCRAGLPAYLDHFLPITQGDMVAPEGEQTLTTFLQTYMTDNKLDWTEHVLKVKWKDTYDPAIGPTSFVPGKTEIEEIKPK